LSRVVEHFEKWPLLGEKAVNFIKLREIFKDKWG
jgi:hypothetical protein